VILPMPLPAPVTNAILRDVLFELFILSFKRMKVLVVARLAS